MLSDLSTQIWWYWVKNPDKQRPILVTSINPLYRFVLLPKLWFSFCFSLLTVLLVSFYFSYFLLYFLPWKITKIILLLVSQLHLIFWREHHTVSLVYCVRLSAFFSKAVFCMLGAYLLHMTAQRHTYLCFLTLIYFLQALIHGLNRHYYSLAINYRKNELEQKVCMLLFFRGGGAYF